MEKSNENLSKFNPGYEIHKRIQSGKLSVFMLTDEQSNQLDAAMDVVNEYVDKYGLPDPMPNDLMDWANEKMLAES